MTVIWECDGNSFFAADYDHDGAPLYRLTVERLAHGGWGWAAWRPGEPVAHGMAGTVQEAMRAAEAAVAR